MPQDPFIREKFARLRKRLREPTDNKLGPTSKQSREAERQRVVEEYVIDLRDDGQTEGALLVNGIED